MIKNKHGFTLIELLAVIVILGLLALIVTPGVAKVIRNSKMNTAKASLEGYVREIENASTLYLTDTGDYPYSLNQLELDGKNISKIENPIVEFGYGEIEKVVVEIDGIYCKYEKGIDTICREESFYSYMKNSIDIPALFEKYGISEICYNDYDNNVDFCDEEESDWAGFYEDYYSTFFGLEIPREKIKSIEFTNIEPEGEENDISLNNTNDVLLYSKVTDEMYDIKIYSEKEIMFPEDSSQMFLGLDNLDKLVLENINTSNVINMSRMFEGVGSSIEVFTLDLGNRFDTSNVINMSEMFFSTGYSSKVFTLNLGDRFVTNNVTDMHGMFANVGFESEKISLDLGNKFDTSKVTNMTEMFFSTGRLSKGFNLDLGDKFDTSKVTNMSYMFAYTGSNNPNFILDLSTFDTSKVTNMESMFLSIPFLKTIYVSDKWTTDAVTESTDMFSGCTSLPNFNSNVVDKTNAHYGSGGYLTLKN